MIQDTYTELITEKIIREILAEGTSPSVSEILTRLAAFLEGNDLSEPLFISENYTATTDTSSSVALYNSANTTVQQDLLVLFRHLLSVSDQAISNFERWRTEARLLEGRLDDLNERLTSLLLLNQDTAGFFNFVQDNFVDNSKVDLANTTAYVNVEKGLVHLGTNTTGVTRINTSSLIDDDVEFTVLSRNNLVSVNAASGSSTKYVVTDARNYWQERVHTNKPAPVSAELKINLGAATSISRIDLDLHMANQNSTVQITPLYSTDNYNWQQLPISSPTRSVVDKTSFQFAPVSAKWVKFIFTKAGFDQAHKGLYVYEFGVDEIAFYNEAFSASGSSLLLSQPLSVLDLDGNVEEFSKVVLEVCEEVPDYTSISYAIGVTNSATDEPASYVPIDPLTRTNTTQPTVLDFGDLTAVSLSGVLTSYDPSGATSDFINPGQSFTLIQSVSGGTAATVSGLSSAPRYSFLNSNERILDHEVGSGVLIAQNTLEVWRNINLQGSTVKVRGYSNGWGFSDPWYKTTVHVGNADGYQVDFGGETVIIDGSPEAGLVSFDPGRHSVAVHKNNWKVVVTSGVSDLASLKVADMLYPYNHRYLVEGLVYPTSYPTTEEKVYRGFDIVAEHFMKEVSVFDMLNNVAADDYSRFAIDRDTPDASRQIDGAPATADEQGSNSVFVLKVDESNPDFVNEQFLLKFKSANSLFKYLKLKATLSTTETNITPFLDSYRIKLSS
jgi:hypothetical protein